MSNMRIIKIADNMELEASKSVDITTNPETQYGISLRGIDGYASLQIKVSGDGLLSCYVLLSNNGEDFVRSETALFDEFAEDSGPALDGNGMFTISFGFVARQIGFRFIESGGEPVTFSAWLCLI